MNVLEALQGDHTYLSVASRNPLKGSPRLPLKVEVTCGKFEVMMCSLALSEGRLVMSFLLLSAAACCWKEIGIADGCIARA